MNLTELAPSAVQNVVALEIAPDGNAVLFTRNGERINTTEKPFHPFLILQNEALLTGFQAPFKLHPLRGEGAFRTVAVFSELATYDDARKFLKDATGLTPGSPSAPYKIISDLTQQALIELKLRLFAGMEFNDVRRLQLDIETLCEPGYDFPNPKRSGDAIAILAMSDNTGWECALSLRDFSEKELLEEFVRIFRERDPDVLEGHNLFRFDLPYLEERAKRHKVKLRLGRDDSTPVRRNSRFSAAERTVNYTRYDLYGRHIADTYHLALFYDAVNRDLDGFGLKTIARHFRVCEEDREYVDASDMNHVWAADPDAAIRYCLGDVRETRAIAEILAPSSFYQTQIIPISYQNCIVRGNATRIDAIFLAEYLRRGEAIPKPEPGRPFAGALTKSFHDGVFDQVLHCDVRSLYPSIILAEQWSPKRDAIGVFRTFLETLRAFRLEAKDLARNAPSRDKKQYFNSLQSTFKILINSFYGYLGFEQGFLNDFDMAERVTAKGRDILEQMLAVLNDNHANVLEMDTDGIYFQPVPGTSGETYLSAISQRLPAGIEVELDEAYRAMFAYKSKNYALLKNDGELILAGAALKSRGLEPFQRRYIRRLILALLHRDSKTLLSLDDEFENAIRTHAFPLADLAKSETLSDSPDAYRKKMSAPSFRRSAAYELILRSNREYRQGDTVSFYITGQKKRVAVVDAAKLLSDGDESNRDENIEYYLDKLRELREKFARFLPPGKPDEQPDLFV